MGWWQDYKTNYQKRLKENYITYPSPSEFWRPMKKHVTIYLIVNAAYFFIVTYLGMNKLVGDKLLQGSLGIIFVYMMVELFWIIYNMKTVIFRKQNGNPLQTIRNAPGANTTRSPLKETLILFISIAIVVLLTMILGN